MDGLRLPSSASCAAASCAAASAAFSAAASSAAPLLLLHRRPFFSISFLHRNEEERRSGNTEQLEILASLLSRPPRPFSSAASQRKPPLPRGKHGARIPTAAPQQKSAAMREQRRRQRRWIAEGMEVGEAELGEAMEESKHEKDEDANRGGDGHGDAGIAEALSHISAGRLPLALHYASLAASSGDVVPPQKLHRLYSQLILLASRHHRRDIAFDLLAELGSSSRLFLSLRDCTSLMAACRKIAAHEAVLGLFEWWKASGFVPNTVMYEIVVRSQAEMGRSREAVAIYWEMEEIGCVPDLRTYSALMEACAELGDSSKALRLYSRMKEQGMVVEQSGIYTSLEEACRKDGRVAKARQFSLAAAACRLSKA